MHSKQKGNIGFTATILVLQKNGFNVFSELGDFSKIDLIAEKNKKLITIQVKYAKEKNGVISIPLRKCGPNGYQYTYTSEDIDWFALFCPANDEVYWISSKEACRSKTYFSLRLTSPKKNNLTCHLAANYQIDRILRDHTQNILRDDDMVQTTTKEILASES